MSVNTISLIRKLSDSDAIDFANALGWINPIPDTAEDIKDKLNNAKKRLNYMECVGEQIQNHRIMTNDIL